MRDVSKIQKELELNDDIDEELRESLKEVISDIFEYFEKKSYTRWVREKDVTRAIKHSSYKLESEENDSYFKRYPRLAGYHIKPDGVKFVKRKISIQKNTGMEKNALSHENIHALANGSGGFNKFWGEGITEFLNKYITDSKKYSYPNNVKCVAVMLKMFGVRIIRDYLTKEGESFFLRLAEEIDGNGRLNEINSFTSDTFEDFEKMNKNFELFHKSKHLSKSQNEKEDPQKYFKEAIGILVDKYFDYEKAKIRNMFFYTNGKVDIKKFKKKLNDVKSNLSKVKYDEQLFDEKYDELIENLLENTHLLEGLDKDEREAKKEYMKNAIKNQDELDQENDEVFKKANENFEIKVLRNTLSREHFIEKIGIEKTRFSYQKLFDTLYKIKEVTGISNEEIFKYINEEKIVSDSNNLIEAFEKYGKIRAFENEKREPYCKIKTTPVIVERDGKAFFIQREDNEYKLLLFDKETGNIESIDLNNNDRNGVVKVKKLKEYSGWNEELPKEINTNLIYDDDVYEVEGLSEDGRKDYISIDTQNDKIIFENKQEKIMVNLEDGFYNLKEVAIQNFVAQKSVKVQESVELINDIINRSKQTTTLSDFAATINGIEIEEELQK